MSATASKILLCSCSSYREDSHGSGERIRNQVIGKVGDGRYGVKLQEKKKEKQGVCVFAAKEGSSSSANSSKSEEPIPSWARPDSDVPPPWATSTPTSQPSKLGFQIPFFVYLLASAVTAIAAIGSVFEYANQRPAFGILNSDSIFYAPLLGFFAFTGIPTSAFLWLKSVDAANKEAEEQDKRDGYL